MAMDSKRSEHVRELVETPETEPRRYNPYIFGPPVQDPEFFFGREHELAIMKDTITHLAPGLRQSMAVVGPRRIGKTSLLYQLVRRLEPTPNATALMSTEQIGSRSSLVLTQEILSVLHTGIQDKHADIQVRLDLLEGPPPSGERIYQTFQRDMRRLNDALAARKRPAAVLMIDEVEGLLDFGGMRVLGVFRHLAQSLPYVLFVVAGSDRLYYLINDTTSPFFNVFKTITVAPLPEESARAMIQEPARDAHLRFEPAAVDEVVRLSGGVPYLVNMICHYAVERVLTNNGSTVTLQQIEAARRHILANEHGYFLYIWQRAQSIEKVILYTLAVVQGARTVENVADDVEETIHVRQAVVQIKEYLTELVQRQILRQDEAGRYGFNDRLLPVWLRENLTESQVVEESRGDVATLEPEVSPDGLKAELHKSLISFFDTSELYSLCFDLGINYDDLPGEGKAQKARELILYLERHSRIPELLEISRRLRPHISWGPQATTPPEWSPQPKTKVMTEQVTRSRLRYILDTYFNESELRVLCADLSVDYDSLFGESKADKARELITLRPILTRHNSLAARPTSSACASFSTRAAASPSRASGASVARGSCSIFARRCRRRVISSFTAMISCPTRFSPARHGCSSRR
jgi:AAA+ ATPase superfamily predicted ATPase